MPKNESVSFAAISTHLAYHSVQNKWLQDFETHFCEAFHVPYPQNCLKVSQEEPTHPVFGAEQPLRFHAPLES
jgi:hypothetical protein